MIDIEASKKRFDETTQNHQMRIWQDSGVHRHLRFKQPDTSDRWFEIVTWPGSLCIGGDMGTYVFSRVNDMFEFFRKGQINPNYWSEKLESGAKFRGATEFSIDAFRNFVKDAVSTELDCMPSVTDEVINDIVDEIIADSDVESYSEDVAEMVGALYLQDCEFDSDDIYDWQHEHIKLRLENLEFSQGDMREYTFHFIWCLHAIVWAIEQYDKAKEPPHEPQET